MLTTELFSPITSNKTDLLGEIERPILVNSFSTGNNEVLLMLTENYLVLCENIYTKAPSHYLKFNFSVKSEVLFHTLSNLGVFILLFSGRTSNRYSQASRDQARKIIMRPKSNLLFTICQHP